MEAAAIALAAARGLHDCGVLSAFGVVLARAVGTAGTSGDWRRLLFVSVALAWLTAPVWLVLQAGEMSGATTLREALAAAPVALLDTGFGHALLLRLVLLAIALGVVAWRGSGVAIPGALIASASACVAQYRMGHAAAPDGPWQAQAFALHMLAAGAWIGGLLPLAIGLGDDPVRTARRFSRIGLAAVAILAATAFIQGAILVGGLPGLLGSAYGWTVLVKTGLFALLLGFAGVNRFRLSPALGGAQPARAVVRLRRSIYAEAAVGAVTVLAAAWLSALPPGAHEQPVWPLPWQPDWAALDDPDIVARLWAGMGVLAASAACGLGALRWRPLWLAGAAALGSAIWLIVPRLGAFAAPAYPTSFFESPTGFTKASVAAGAPLYQAQCAACHGPLGYGDGPLASGLKPPPAPLTGFHLLARSDGEMFWLLTKGITAANGTAAMPGFATQLTEDQRWAVIDYVRTLAGAEPGDSPVLSHHHH